MIIKSYLNILIPIGIGSCIIFVAGIFYIFFTLTGKNQHANHLDVESIAGEDTISTQLDLARAYIEIGQNKSAQTMLEYILAQGNDEQRMEAKQLLGLI